MQAPKNRLFTLLFMKQILPIVFSIFFLLVIQNVHSQSADQDQENKFLLGVQAGVTNYVSPAGALYFAFDFNLWSVHFLARGGYGFKSAEVDFNGVNDMSYNSHGSYIDLNIFVARNVYFGLGLGVALNLIKKEDQLRYEAATRREPPTYFIGIMTKAQSGYNISLSDRFWLNLEVEVALNIFSEEAAIGYPDGQARPYQGSSINRSPLLAQGTIGLIYTLK